MLTQPARRAHLQVIWEGWAPSSDNSAILREVDAPVDVAVAVGDSVPMSLCGALLSCGAGLILPIDHELNTLFSSSLCRKESIEYCTYAEGTKSSLWVKQSVKVYNTATCKVSVMLCNR